MWCERIDVTDVLRASRTRVRLSRNLAKELADAQERSTSMIVTSEKAIFDSDEFIRQNRNYFIGTADPSPESSVSTIDAANKSRQMLRGRPPDGTCPLVYFNRLVVLVHERRFFHAHILYQFHRVVRIAVVLFYHAVGVEV